MLSRLYYILKSTTGLMVILVFALMVILFFSSSQPFQQSQVIQQAKGSSQIPTPKKSPSPPPLASPSPTHPTPLPSSSTVEVVSGPLAPGLKIVLIDQGEDDCSWIMWMANTSDLTRARIITKFHLKRRYE